LKGRIQREGLTEEKPETISQQLGVSVEDVGDALQYQQIPSSLSEVMYCSGGEKAEITIESKLVDESPIRKIEEIEGKLVMRSFINTLPDIELMIWDMYSNHMSQGNIGKRVGVTQTQISRILKKSIKELQLLEKRRELQSSANFECYTERWSCTMFWLGCFLGYIAGSVITCALFYFGFRAEENKKADLKRKE